jgi:hypothetical protein
MTRRVEDLVQLICGSPEHPLTAVLRQWCLASRPVLEFAEAHATKLRKKVRLARSGEECDDLLAELAIGNLLAQDRKFQVQYEPQPLIGTRGPDFRATYKGHTQVYVEVTRLRLLPDDPARAAFKLARLLCDKVTQCVSGGINVLTVVVPAELQTVGLVPAAVQLLHTPQQTTDAVINSSAARLSTYRRLQSRLSGILLCSLTPEGRSLTAVYWENPQARRPLPSEIARLLAVR